MGRRLGKITSFAQRIAHDSRQENNGIRHSAGAGRADGGRICRLESPDCTSRREFHRRARRSVRHVVAQGQGRVGQFLGDILFGVRKRNAEGGADL